MLNELAGVTLDAKAVERTAERVGATMARDEAERVEVTHPASQVMYAGVDGTGIPIRPKELAGRPGKQPDGSAKTR